MSLSVRFSRVFLAAMLLPGCAVAQQAKKPTTAGNTAPRPAQDSELLRFVRHLEAWYPDSTYEVKVDKSYPTASGTYRMVQVDRTCALQFLSGSTSILIDEVTGSAWVGAVATLRTDQMGSSLEGLKPYVASFLPQALAQNMGLQTSLSWDVKGRRSGALIPYVLQVQSGYGRYPKSGAVTADGKYLVLGSAVPWSRDPVEYRRAALDASPLVMWDHPGKGSKVEIVEFSDFECPGCKAKWPVIRKVLDTFGTKVRHGMVNFPLTTIHPWSFRAASAAWCVDQQGPGMLIPLKEQFYSLQSQMEVSQVGPTAQDFVSGHDLDESAFQACFLKPASLAAVNSQLGLGSEMGVNATPTYFINGWKVQAPNESWLIPLVKRLMNGEEP